MGIYKNDYNKKEDEVLWELHEIRNYLHKKLKKQSIDEINNNALSKYKDWKSKRRKERKNKKPSVA